jgi:hypothetical protein
LIQLVNYVFLPAAEQPSLQDIAELSPFSCKEKQLNLAGEMSEPAELSAVNYFNPPPIRHERKPKLEDVRAWTLYHPFHLFCFAETSSHFY